MTKGVLMDFIEGETLEEYLQKQPEGHLSVKETLGIGIQLCTVLAYLHNRQPPVIFRDLKPSNIMLTPEENLYLIDFGIARHFKPGQKKDTIALGSPGYAAPEQYGKGQTTPQSDIFSLGAILHHLLSGNDPSQSPFVFAPLYLSSTRTQLSLTRIIFSIVGMVWGTIGCILALVSLFSVDLLLFPAGLANICIGLMIFFLASMSKSSLLRSTVGIFVGAIAIVSGVAIMIIAAYFPNVIINEVGGGRGSGGLESGTVMVIAGVIILGSASFRRFELKNP
jgi:serine/threonine protein kinase